MSKPTITQFFENLGAKLTNHYWSWGAQRKSDGVVFLRVWRDETKRVGARTFRKLLDPAYPESLGYPERAGHIELIRAGTPGYMVILTPVPGGDPSQREIETYNSTVLVPIGQLVTDGGIVWGECLPPVPVDDV